MTKIVVTLVLLLVALNIYATLSLAKCSSYEPIQKWLQGFIIWVFPILGALLVLSLAKGESTEKLTTDLSSQNFYLAGFDINDGTAEADHRSSDHANY